MSSRSGRVVRPDFGAVAATANLEHVVGALLTVSLLVAVGVLIVCAVTWAIASSTGHWQTSARARVGVLVALGGAGLAGAALAWLNFLLDLGAAL